MKGRKIEIEDELEIVNFLKSSLETEMFAVDVASDGERGAFLGRSNDYDLIILDYILPKLNGDQVLASIRRDKPNVPVIILTVKSEFTIKNNLFNLGADDYLTKPFLFQELKLSLTLDNNQQIVRRGGRQIYLTRKEFMLLEYLLRNKGKVITRGTILEHAWDINSDPFSNSLETHITSLRKKLNKIPGKKLIHTFHGRGYKLDIQKM
ncbi:MAG: response regulator transcription factor [Candidatus Falkowbacteria bacterium]|nr:response regulator transcription factor [Candidatus Falkowbacteria bacterium]